MSEDLEQTQTRIPTKLPHMDKYSSHTSFGDVKAPHSLPRHFPLFLFNEIFRLSVIQLC